MPMTRRHHGTGGKGYRHQELLYDPDLPAPTHAERAHTLVASVGVGTLCTLTAEPAGHPYGSFVTYGIDGAEPVFLTSSLAEHTRNLEADPRCSLLVAAPGEGDPLARARVTLVGTTQKLTQEAQDSARSAFLGKHPGARFYADFDDFAFWRMHTESIRYIGGYGRMSWVQIDAWRTSEPDPLWEAAGGIISHMNADHPDALVLLCRAFSKATDTREATMVSVDRYGLEMSADTEAGPRPIRVAFEQGLASAKDARSAIVSLVKQARSALSDDANPASNQDEKRGTKH